MANLEWQQYFVPSEDTNLAVFELGENGLPVILLNGGPGDDHTYLRQVAERLVPQFRCILYDQRGCGLSRLAQYNEENLHLNKFWLDLEKLRQHLGGDKVRLIGHSWGATLALSYACAYPESVASAVLIGMGPMTADFSAVASANLYQPLTQTERDELDRLRRERKATNDFEKYRELHIRSIEFNTRHWFYSREAAAKFITDFSSSYNFNPQIVNYLAPSAEQFNFLEQLKNVTARLQVIYGYQDFEPITQAYVIKAQLPQTEISMINKCGHVPWLEQPEIFYQALTAFLLDEEQKVERA